MTNKRDDLQILRAFAIIAVLCFHLWPEIIPYGYLGVDIFFVLSGYLMTKILSKNDSLLLFYYSRIKRIFPIYLIILSTFLIIGYIVLLPAYFDFLKIETIWSIFMINNFESMFHQKQYFELISEYKFFLHTWSLGVEIQFYILAPFLIKFILNQTNSTFLCFFIASFSWLLQTFIKNDAIAFGFVFCRIWQFLAGTFAYCFTHAHSNLYNILDKEENNNIASNSKHKSLLFLATVCLITVCFLPPSVILKRIEFAVFLRLICTFSACLFITSSTLEPLNLPVFINLFLVYIGNASYVIYLIHWPTIVYLKYFGYGQYYSILIIVFASIFVHECFEKPLIKQTWIVNGCCITLCYSIIIMFLFININTVCLCTIFGINFSQMPQYEEQMTIDPLQGNQEAFDSCKHVYYNTCTTSPLIDQYMTARPYHHDFDLYCSFKLNPNATKTIFITGNSFVYFQIRGILDAIKQAKTEFSEAFVVAHPGCSLIAGDLNPVVTDCAIMNGSHDKILDIVKPDIIIHTSRISQFVQLGDQTLVHDRYYDEFEKSILHLANYTDRLIMIEPHPHLGFYNYTNPLAVAHAIQNNESLTQFRLSITEFHRIHDSSWDRVKEVAKICPKCILIPTQHLYCEADFCPIIDPKTKIARFCDEAHITPKQSLNYVSDLIKAIDEEENDDEIINLLK